MKRRIYKKWLKNPLNKRLIWKFCKPMNKIPVAYVYEKTARLKEKRFTKRYEVTITNIK